MNNKVSVIIPNYNGIAYLPGVLKSLNEQNFKEFETILVDNGSSDGSIEYARGEFPQVKILALDDNYGFSRAVNEGIRISESEFILLLNNDTITDSDFVENLLEGIQRHPKAFSCQAKMIRMDQKDRMDDAGNYYCALGWAYARGKGKSLDRYDTEQKIFSACAGAAIYRKSILEEIGIFDCEHFAYLEDLDIGYRARIRGYENWYIPSSRVYHIGSGTSGSRYNLFKIRYSSRNNIYMIRKNMPLLQVILNLPFLIPGFTAKLFFFAGKGFGREYLAGIKNGMQLSVRETKVPFQMKYLKNYCLIQWELWVNVIRRFKN